MGSPRGAAVFGAKQELDALTRHAASQGRNLTDLISRVLGEYAVANELLQPVDADEFKARWSLIDRATETARRICREGRFDENITYRVFEDCIADPAYAADYKDFVGDDPYKRGNPKKAINKDIGHAIKAAIGARVKKGPGGKPMKVNVVNSVIQSYTQMEDFDRTLVG
jgi:hypothetical protein